MTELRDFLDEQVSQHVPAGRPEMAEILQRASARRRHRVAAAAGITAGAVAAVGVLAFQVLGPGNASDSRDDLAVPSPSSSAAPADSRRGEVAPETAFSCVEQYSPAAVATRGFAFDGTIISIDTDAGGTSTTSLATDSWQVTFEVHEWFVGGDGVREVTVTMFRPMPASDDRPAAYGEGTRLLVSGESQTGGADHLGWSCGFTRYYDPETATDWRTATT